MYNEVFDSADIKKVITEFFMGYPPRRHNKGAVLTVAGEDPKGIYFLVSGQVGQYDISENGNKVMVNVFKAGAFFPVSWAINKTPNPYFFEATTDVYYHLAPPSDVICFLQEHPRVLFDLLRRVYLGTDVLLQRISLMAGGTALQRVAFELQKLAERFGVKNETGIVVTVTGSELAAISGLARETVSRELGKMQTAGLIQLGRGKISVLDLAAVAAHVRPKA